MHSYTHGACVLAAVAAASDLEGIYDANLQRALATVGATLLSSARGVATPAEDGQTMGDEELEHTSHQRLGRDVATSTRDDHGVTGSNVGDASGRTATASSQTTGFEVEPAWLAART